MGCTTGGYGGFHRKKTDGKFKENFGPGFFDEATNLMMEIF